MHNFIACNVLKCDKRHPRYKASNVWPPVRGPVVVSSKPNPIQRDSEIQLPVPTVKD